MKPHGRKWRDQYIKPKGKHALRIPSGMFHYMRTDGAGYRKRMK